MLVESGNLAQSWPSHQDIAPKIMTRPHALTTELAARPVVPIALLAPIEKALNRIAQDRHSSLAHRRLGQGKS